MSKDKTLWPEGSYVMLRLLSGNEFRRRILGATPHFFVTRSRAEMTYVLTHRPTVHQIGREGRWRFVTVMSALRFALWLEQLPVDWACADADYFTKTHREYITRLVWAYRVNPDFAGDYPIPLKETTHVDNADPPAGDGSGSEVP